MTAKAGQGQFLFFESEGEGNRRGKLQVSTTAKTRITVRQKVNKEGGWKGNDIARQRNKQIKKNKHEQKPMRNRQSFQPCYFLSCLHHVPVL